MTDLEFQLEALRTGAAYAPLTDRAFLRITGPDATRWLNGMVTNNIKDLAPGQGNYNFLLNAQGRILGDCTITREPGEGEPAFLLETDAAQLETLHQHLDKFIIMDEVELLRVPTSSSLLVSPQPDALISPEALEARRILAGIPKYGTDIRNTDTAKDLPQETGQTHALSFNKGCYLGQEIVERIHSRGQVHRIFTQFALTGDMPTLPAPLEANGKPAGELTSAAKIEDTIYALGYARREALDTRATFTYSGGTAKPRQHK